MKIRTAAVLGILIVLILAISLAVSAAKLKGTIAQAVFEVDHGNDCTETTATVYVYDNQSYEAGDPLDEQPRVDFTYSVFGQPTSPGCDGLWYYDLHGSAVLNEGELTVLRGRRGATLNKTMEVYDEEAGTFIDVNIQVQWTMTSGAGGTGGMVAAMSVTSPSLDDLYTIDPLSPSSSASVSRIGKS